MAQSKMRPAAPRDARPLPKSRGDQPAREEDVGFWLRAAKFAFYAQMHSTAREYLNKATLLASLHEFDGFAAEIGRLAHQLGSRLNAVEHQCLV